MGDHSADDEATAAEGGSHDELATVTSRPHLPVASDPEPRARSDSRGLREPLPASPPGRDDPTGPLSHELREARVPRQRGDSRGLRRPLAPAGPVERPSTPSVATGTGASQHGSPTAPAGRSGSTAHTTTIASPLEALERDEILRTRRFCFVALAIVVCGLGAIPLLPGDPDATALLVAAGGVSITGIIFLFRQTTDPLRFRSPLTNAAFSLPTIAVVAAIPFFGAFSPAPVLLILGVYFCGLGASSRLANAVYGVCALSQLLIGAAVIMHWTRDTGLVHADNLSARAQWLVQGLVQVVLLGTFVTARVSRHTALTAIGELERAVRVAAHREALLLEAREELERALRAGRGRFTDQVIGGWLLGEVIGRGAMGEVYAATDAAGGAGGRTVAIKLLSQASLSNPQHVQRFLRELRAAMQIRSPNVVEVLAIGEQPVPYLVMERLEGNTLGETLRGKRALATAKVVELVRQVGAGLAAAAAAGIVHRDIKPQNLFFANGCWKILDFGVARHEDHGDTLTSGNVVGTPSYMAPEQARGATVDHRTDLYALAACAYRALTGHPPHAAGEIAETLYRVVHTAPRKPTDLIALSPDVDRVLAIGLAKRADDRFSTAVELAAAVALAVAGELPDPLRERGDALIKRGAWS
nr:protein kinase [Kofleriaceae bacterium]